MENTTQELKQDNWQPTASLAALQKRAAVLRKIRAFFQTRDILEVDTPLLAHGTVTDPHLYGIAAELQTSDFSNETERYYLQTSPEYAMKRLLAAQYGPIYQICKAFRGLECGSKHNTEFTMLEWYCPHFDHLALMDQVEDLLKVILGDGPFERMTYAEIFKESLGLDPHFADLSELVAAVEGQGIMTTIEEGPDARDTALQLLMTHVIEPTLITPTFIYDFPASQAALAKIRPGIPSVAERFEVYVQGIELANGYHELTDFDEHCARFAKDNTLRTELGLPNINIDERFLGAIASGLPNCAGVALGIDRLMMLVLKEKEIQGVVPFVTERA